MWRRAVNKRRNKVLGPRATSLPPALHRELGGEKPAAKQRQAEKTAVGRAVVSLHPPPDPIFIVKSLKIQVRASCSVSLTAAFLSLLRPREPPLPPISCCLPALSPFFFPISSLLFICILSLFLPFLHSAFPHYLPSPQLPAQPRSLPTPRVGPWHPMGGTDNDDRRPLPKPRHKTKEQIPPYPQPCFSYCSTWTQNKDNSLFTAVLKLSANRCVLFHSENTERGSGLLRWASQGTTFTQIISQARLVFFFS